MCRSCGKVWRRKQKKNIDVTSENITLDLLPLEVFEAYTETAIKYNMEDFICKCVLCGSNSFEIELGFYQCSNKECSFEWECF